MSADGRTIRDVMVDALSEPNMGFAEGRHGRLVERQLLRLAEAGFVVRAAAEGGTGQEMRCDDR